MDKGVEPFFVFLLNKPGERFHFAANLSHLPYGVRIEQDFAQQAVVLAEHAAGDAQVPLEGCARRVLMLHHRRENERGNKGNAQGIGHRFVVLLKGVFVYRSRKKMRPM